ncbi:ATP-dependent sacrificial sulfur transferase LarE [Dethiosulfatarculus sandiegensis]|uniref:ATP-dependent sacrificial sulfur transferase LarE n=1 Tax=Dethiosulfatarculus sandiegensis TaxID=1429043 RepID=UPI0018D005AD|nr:ATP-dependent sacrificial sulfur transferase LarE [Dethiosulfatarculus sandiegensis]
MSLTREADQELKAKWQKLITGLKARQRVLVSFSGGADSSVLLAAAKEALGKNAQALIFSGAFTPQWEMDDARKVADELGVKLWEVDAQELGDPDIQANPNDRCYFCKRLRLKYLLNFAREKDLGVVLEGSQADDAFERRPGKKALDELGGVTPLADAGIGKEDIRILGRSLGLATADAPSGACLASRVPAGTPLNPELLKRIAEAEHGLRKILGYGQIRVRDHFPIARLEFNPDIMARVMQKGIRQEVVTAVLEAGYSYACLDLKGYRNGGADTK